MKARAIRRVGAAAAGIVVLLPVLAGCGSSEGDTSSAAMPSGTSTLPQSIRAVQPESGRVHDADRQSLLVDAGGGSLGGDVTDPQGESTNEVIEVTNKTKKIADGVTARVVSDIVYDHGKATEVTDDWYAQDSEGNIWYFGEDTAEFHDGKKDTSGSFEAGVDGAEAGVAMPAHPELGLTYREEYYKGHAEDRSKVLALDQQVEVPAGHFTRRDPDRRLHAARAGRLGVQALRQGRGAGARR